MLFSNLVGKGICQQDDSLGEHRGKGLYHGVQTVMFQIPDRTVHINKLDPSN